MGDPEHPRRFTGEPKRQIVDLHHSGKPLKDIEIEYDLGHSAVCRRVKLMDATGSTRAADNRTPEEQRLLDSEKGNRRLRMEVDALKQAAPIFAQKQR